MGYNHDDEVGGRVGPPTPRGVGPAEAALAVENAAGKRDPLEPLVDKAYEIAAKHGVVPPMAGATAAKYSKPQPYLGVIGRFPRAILAISRVSEYGAKKHEVPMGDTSYVDVPQAGILYNEAEARHLIAQAIDGNFNPDDGGLLHKAQKAWNALADLEVEMRRLGLKDLSYADPTRTVPKYMTADEGLARRADIEAEKKRAELIREADEKLYADTGEEIKVGLTD